MSLIAELDVDDALQGFTVVFTHLEDHTRSACRVDQIAALLSALRNTLGAIGIGGDLNTSGTDGTPTSVRYEIKKRVTNPRFWVKQGNRWFTPLAAPAIVTLSVNLWKNHGDKRSLLFAESRPADLQKATRLRVRRRRDWIL